MALVNKLKQYDKTIFVVGGKAFTSTILQKNCHEFISYESLLDNDNRGSRPPRELQFQSQTLPLEIRERAPQERREPRPPGGSCQNRTLTRAGIPAMEEAIYKEENKSSQSLFRPLPL